MGKTWYAWSHPLACCSFLKWDKYYFTGAKIMEQSRLERSLDENLVQILMGKEPGGDTEHSAQLHPKTLKCQWQQLYHAPRKVVSVRVILTIWNFILILRGYIPSRTIHSPLSSACYSLWNESLQHYCSHPLSTTILLLFQGEEI